MWLLEYLMYLLQAHLCSIIFKTILILPLSFKVILGMGDIFLFPHHLWVLYLLTLVYLLECKNPLEVLVSKMLVKLRLHQLGVLLSHYLVEGILLSCLQILLQTDIFNISILHPKEAILWLLGGTHFKILSLHSWWLGETLTNLIGILVQEILPTELFKLKF